MANFYIELGHKQEAGEISLALALDDVIDEFSGTIENNDKIRRILDHYEISYGN